MGGHVCTGGHVCAWAGMCVCVQFTRCAQGRSTKQRPHFPLSPGTVHPAPRRERVPPMPPAPRESNPAPASGRQHVKTLALHRVGSAEVHSPAPLISNHAAARDPQVARCTFPPPSLRFLAGVRGLQEAFPAARAVAGVAATAAGRATPAPSKLGL